MANIPIDGALARKLSTFLPLTPKELKALADMQSPPLVVKRGRQLSVVRCFATV